MPVVAELPSPRGRKSAAPRAEGAAPRRLLLLRHAKSSWDDSSLADRERPLAPRGRRAAQAIARHLAVGASGVPTRVLCSSARRTLETLEPLRRCFGPDTTVQIDDAFYLASASRWIEQLRELPDEQADVLAIGHDPGLHDLALALTRPDPSPKYRHLCRKLPTGALVEVEVWLSSWRDLAAGSARLVEFTRPRDLD